MKNQISKSDFTFIPEGYGRYKVSYKSPVTSKTFSKTITDMTIIDLTKNEDSPKISNLKLLKKMIKRD